MIYVIAELVQVMACQLFGAKNITGNHVDFLPIGPFVINLN